MSERGSELLGGMLLMALAVTLVWVGFQFGMLNMKDTIKMYGCEAVTKTWKP